MPLDPVAYKTLVLLAAFFGLAGFAVFAYEKWKGVRDDNLRQRYYSWYMIAPVVLVPAYFGGAPFAILVCALALFCLREFFQVTHMSRMRVLTWLGRLSGVLLVLTAALTSNVPEPLLSVAHQWEDIVGTRQPILGAPLFYVLPIGIIMTVLMVPVALGRYKSMLHYEATTIFGVLYFGWFLSHLVFIRNLPNGFGYLIFLSAAVVLNDVMAYTIGRLFGKHKMAPHISPKKTWEGFLGGVAGSVSAVFLMNYTLAGMDLRLAFAAALMISVLGPLGDLTVSVIKRDMHVKDSGTLIPGHGGLLDRCDSLIFATPAFYYFLILVRHFGR